MACSSMRPFGLRVALFTAFASERLQVGNQVKAWLSKVVGVLFIGLGIRLAVSAQN